LAELIGLNFNVIREKIKKDLKRAIEKSLKFKIKEVHLEHPENPKFGDYSSNFALENFKEIKKQKSEFKTPLELAQKIAENFPQRRYLKEVKALNPGFINFHLSETFLQNQIKEILQKKGDYGLDQKEKEKRKKIKVQVEFLSANPTGPLHVGNCRGGFAGDVLANVLLKLGYKVQREYYINDIGTQIEKLVQSVKARYEQLQGKKTKIPPGGYPGEYVKEIAKKMLKKKTKNFREFTLKEILQMIKKTTERMGIKYDCWFPESFLYQSSQVKKALNLLKKKNLIYEKEGAVWFKATKFGDEKDRVLIKSDGQSTYILSDLAYHLNKFEKRKFDKVILFWGADHHGYVPRFLGMIEAIGHKGKAQVKLYQLLNLVRRGRKIKMSKRKGEYVTVDDLLDEIGLDAARFHFLMHSLDTPMTLDLTKAAEKSEKNPVYYVQYAHARICSICKKAKTVSQNIDFSLLKHPAELNLIKKLIQFPEILVDIEKSYQLQTLPAFSIKLADLFHKFYEECRVLSEDKKITAARLALVKATKIILAQTLALMGISAPEKM